MLGRPVADGCLRFNLEIRLTSKTRSVTFQSFLTRHFLCSPFGRGIRYVGGRVQKYH